MTSNVNRGSLVGIGGGSCSGKSTLAKYLHKELGCSIPVISLDHFVAGPVPIVQGENCYWQNWETTDSVDWKAFHTAIDRAFCTNTGKPIIVEGYLIYADMMMLQRFDCCLFMTVSKEAAYQRRKSRAADDPFGYIVSPSVYHLNNPNWLQEYFNEVVYPHMQKHDPRNQIGMRKDMFYLDADSSKQEVQKRVSDCLKECLQLKKVVSS